MRYFSPAKCRLAGYRRSHEPGATQGPARSVCVENVFYRKAFYKNVFCKKVFCKKVFCNSDRAPSGDADDVGGYGGGDGSDPSAGSAAKYGAAG
jgi:hypothetical protein